MAAIYKCTRITNLGLNPDLPGYYLVKTDYINPTIPSPPVQFVTVSIATADVVNDEETKGIIDAQLALLGGDTIDWTL